MLIFTGSVPARVTQGARHPRCPSASCNVPASCTDSDVAAPPVPALRDTEEIKGESIWRGSRASESAVLAPDAIARCRQ